MFSTKDYPLTENDRIIAGYGYSIIEDCWNAVEKAGFKKNSKVLDVASGPSGRMAFCLAAAGLDVVSGDIDKETTDKAKAHLSFMGAAAPEFIRLDACKVDLDDNSFDGAAAANAIHEMPEPAKMLRECARIIKPGGTALFMDFNTKGFDSIDMVHEKLFGHKHNRGSFFEEDTSRLLSSLFASVRLERFEINNVWVCTKA